jgi:HD-GYP domain-containing protein (c-di-GMP phosphodiesterase class II)
MPKSIRPDYRKDLEEAARQMILIHRLDTLIKLILKTIIKNLEVTHAGLLLYDKEKDHFVATVSQGKEGFKLPTGFIKVSNRNPIIKYFNTPELQLSKNHRFLISNHVEEFLKSETAKKDKEKKSFFTQLLFQLNLYNAKVSIPGFFRDKLIYVSFLGRKKRKNNFSRKELSFLSVLSSDVVMAIQNAWYFQDLKAQVERNKSLFLQTVRALTAAIEAKDKYTFGHTERVAKYSLGITKEIKKIKRMPNKKWEGLQEDVRVAAFLHDIGKIGIPESILNKNGPLNKDELRIIQEHPLIGSAILEKIEGLNKPTLGIRYHHERPDGKGYPEGLKKDKIPLIAQILSVADSFDAMTTDRPYRKAFSSEKALTIIKENINTQFPELVVKAFFKYCKNNNI